MNIQTRLLIARVLVSVLAEHLADFARRKLASRRPSANQGEAEHLLTSEPKATSVADRSAKIHREAGILQASSESERPIPRRRRDGGPKRGDAT